MRVVLCHFFQYVGAGFCVFLDDDNDMSDLHDQGFGPGVVVQVVDVDSCEFGLHL